MYVVSPKFPPLFSMVVCALPLSNRPPPHSTNRTYPRLRGDLTPLRATVSTISTVLAYLHRTLVLTVLPVLQATHSCFHGSQRYTSVADGALALEIINVTATKAGELSAAPVDASGRHGQVCISMLRLTVISRRCSRGAVDGLG